mgnify:CR=1 FL=1
MKQIVLVNDNKYPLCLYETWDGEDDDNKKINQVVTSYNSLDLLKMMPLVEAAKAALSKDYWDNIIIEFDKLEALRYIKLYGKNYGDECCECEANYVPITLKKRINPVDANPIPEWDGICLDCGNDLILETEINELVAELASK